MIPYGKQNISSEDVEAVVKVLNSDFLTQGPVVPKFERKLADYCNVPYGVAVNSATSALHIACLALELGSGDYLWTSPNTFVASANCALYCGASVDFVDIDPRTYNLCPDQLEKKLIKAEKEGKLPKIVIPVHFAGQSCNMERIYSLSLKYGFKIIEDASHAVGGKYKDKAIGSCEYSDITVFSFHPVKIITTAEGGMAVTNDLALCEKMNLFRCHGITREESFMQGESHGAWYYEQIELGFNYRMTELQAALGLSQMDRLGEYVQKRQELAKSYNEKLKNLPIIPPFQSMDSYSSFHLYPIRISSKVVSKSKNEIFDYLRSEGIGVNVHYIPVYTQPYYSLMGFKKSNFPNAEKYYEEALSIPLHPQLTCVEQDKVIKVLTSCLK